MNDQIFGLKERERSAIRAPHNGRTWTAQIGGKLLVTTFFGFGLLPLLSGCSKPGPTGAVPPTPEVQVRKVSERAIPARLEFTGHLAAVHHVDIRSRVSGYVIKAPFAEGSLVRSGELLFEIDPRPFVAKHEEAKGEVARAKAHVELAKQEFVRAERLAQQDAIATEELQRRTADLEALTAALAAANAKEAAAALDLEFTRVKAPVSGRVGRALVKAGNLIAGGDANGTLLTTLVTENPMHVLFNVDEPSYRQIMALRAVGKSVAAEVRLANGEPPIVGTIDYASNSLDSRSGTAQARAVVENPQGVLAPGLFARVTIVAETDQLRLLVPETAIGAEQGSRYVLALDEDNKLTYRRIELGERRGDERLVLGGLAAGETIVVNGLQKLRPGMTVRPSEPQLAKN